MEKSRDFCEVCAEEIEYVMEMFDDPDACEHCKFEALMGLIMLGADAALQGCIGRKEN